MNQYIITDNATLITDVILNEYLLFFDNITLIFTVIMILMKVKRKALIGE